MRKAWNYHFNLSNDYWSIWGFYSSCSNFGLLYFYTIVSLLSRFQIYSNVFLYSCYNKICIIFKPFLYIYSLHFSVSYWFYILFYFVLYVLPKISLPYESFKNTFFANILYILLDLLIHLLIKYWLSHLPFAWHCSRHPDLAMDKAN